MTNHDDLQELVVQIKARQDIHDAIVRFSRGADRCDRELMMSAYHPDARDDHGSFNGPVEDFVDWALVLHRDSFIWTSHYISNEYVQVNGLSANAETYVQAILRFSRNGQLYDLIGAGRYLDQFECRNGLWKIKYRLALSDWNRIDRVDEAATTELVSKILRGTRDRKDPSYEFFPPLVDE